MLYVESQRLLDILLPVEERFPREAVHQVDADIFDARPSQSLHRCPHLPGVMPSTQEREPLVGEGLRTHAHTVYGEGVQDFRKVFRHILGVTLDGDLLRRVDGVCLRHCFEELSEQSLREE